MKVKEKIKKIKKFAKNERTLEVLESIAKLGFILFLGVAAPNAAGHIIKLLGWVPDYKNKYRTENVIKTLEEKKLIRYWVKDGKGKMILTKEGEMYLARLKVKKVKLHREAKWDRFWRIITFDIPEELKSNRKNFSRALNLAGMCCLEKSMYVFPYECKGEIYRIAELYEVKKYARYILASKVEPDFRLKSEFPLTALSRK